MLEVSNLVISNFCALTSAAAWIIAATSCLPTPPCTAALGGPVLHARGPSDEGGVVTTGCTSFAAMVAALSTTATSVMDGAPAEGGVAMRLSGRGCCPVRALGKQ